MDIPHSGFSALDRRAEYMRRGQSPSGVIDGVYNDMNRPIGVPNSDTHRDWNADRLCSDYNLCLSGIPGLSILGMIILRHLKDNFYLDTVVMYVRD